MVGDPTTGSDRPRYRPQYRIERAAKDAWIPAAATTDRNRALSDAISLSQRHPSDRIRVLEEVVDAKTGTRATEAIFYYVPDDLPAREENGGARPRRVEAARQRLQAAGRASLVTVVAAVAVVLFLVGAGAMLFVALTRGVP